MDMLKIQKEKLFKEMYEVSATFGITGPIDHPKLAILIDQELPNMKWYHEHGHEKIALAIPGFIVGRSLFNFALPKPEGYIEQPPREDRGGGDRDRGGSRDRGPRRDGGGGGRGGPRR